MIVNSEVPKILGMYLSDTHDVYNNTEQKTHLTNDGFKYLPIVDFIHFSRQEEVRFINGKNINDEIITYNRNTSSRKLNADTVYNNKIEVTQNDLLLGPINIVLNLSQYNITFNTPGDFRKTYLPIKNKKLEEYYGKIIMLTIHTFNNPITIQHIAGYGNYFETLKDNFKNRGNKKNQELLLVLDYLSSKWLDIKTSDYMQQSHTIKVVTMTVVEETDLFTVSDKIIYLSYRDCFVTIEDIINAPDHPGTENVFNTGDLKGYLRDNSFVCYIVDNDDLISDRYINVAGSVKKIIKIKNPSMVNGLYLITTNNATGTKSEVVCKLEDLNNNQYVFKSIEEANAGADIRSQYKDILEKNRAELESLRLERANENIALKAKYERESLEIKTEYEKRLREQSLTFDREMQELKKSFEEFKLSASKEDIKTKSDYDTFRYQLDRKSYQTKSDYEEGRYARDTTIESIKTVGAIAGLLAGGFVLYSKINGK